MELITEHCHLFDADSTILTKPAGEIGFDFNFLRGSDKCAFIVSWAVLPGGQYVLFQMVVFRGENGNENTPVISKIAEFKQFITQLQEHVLGIIKGQQFH